MASSGLFQGAEAAATAEFNAKKWVWVRDVTEGYLAGWVNKEEEDGAEVVMAHGGEFRKVPFHALFKANPPKFDRVEDIADLTVLNEASVVHNLRLRYGSGAIYTYSGLFLVAINPYQQLPLYSDSIIYQYRGKRRDENPPHIFAVAERAWVNMGEERENQSILITGESGAGKTESTKKVIQYLAAIASDTQPPPPTPSHSRSNTISSANAFTSTGLPRSNSIRRGYASTNTTGGSNLNSKARLGLLERQILQANPILEAFGNAQTQRNNNSSRFGKFVRVMFAPDGTIAGANIDWYLLEKSRVVFRNEAERSFHVFYQLLAGGGALKDELLLNGEVEHFEYLNKSRREVDGVDDKEEWRVLQAALDLVGLDENEQFDLFRVVAAILHIGNIVITASRADDAMMPDPSQTERVCHLLGLPIAEFTRAVLRPRALAGREWVTHARTRQQALDELSALCKTLYEKSFGSLVDRINRALDRPSSKSTFIGVLDIAGFEIFDINGYEQLLINFTNEKLQQFFNHHMFVLEQEEYSREGIKWDYVNFGLDLQPTIDLIESTGPFIGILSCLDEECIMPKATHLTFTNKLNTIWAGPLTEDEPYHPGREKYEPSRFDQGFIVAHYAANVEYRTEGWLDKNRDPLNDNLTRVLAASSERYVANLFADYADLPSALSANPLMAGRKRTMKKGAFRTLAQRHKEQLSSLMSQLRSTQPHFVRCIVPNTLKKAGRIDVPLVLDQLRCNGVLEGIRIARLGYPNRLAFVDFRQRYEVLTPGIIPRGYMDGREASRRMVAALELDEAWFKIGTSKIFFKAGVLAELEEKRDKLLFDIFSRLQAAARMWSARRQIKKILNRAVAIRTIQRNARIYGALRDWPWWQLYTKVRPLLAATRNDEELRIKEMELALAKERAERDKQEKEALEKLKSTLEADKRKVEDELEAERMLVLEKHSLLERSMERNAALEEEVTSLQNHIDLLDNQLDRTMKLQKDSEEKRNALSQAFDEAAEHLIRLEQEERRWTNRDNELGEQLNEARQECEALQGDIDLLQKANDNLKELVAQGEEDLQRAKERMELAVKELEGRIDVELRNQDLLKDKSDSLESDARQAKEQLAELGRTAAEYSNIIQRKEEQISALNKKLHESKEDQRKASLEILELQSDLDTLSTQLQAECQEHAADVASRDKLVQQCDELRTVLATKTTEESKRNEAERSMQLELSDLRLQLNKSQQDLADARRSALEGQNKLKLELEVSIREKASLEKIYNSLLERERAADSQLSRLRTQFTELEKAKRFLESELLSVKTHHNDTQQELADAVKAKEALKRQLSAAQSKYQDFEDEVLAFQREREVYARQLEDGRQHLETETTKRTQLEKAFASQKAELTKLKSENARFDKDLNKALTDLKNKDWEVKQLLSKQDKTIVEHVHVLEEAKRVTDRQLADAQQELVKNQSLIRSLQAVRSKMSSEVEDLGIKHDRELKSAEKQMKLHRDEKAQALSELDRERQGKQEAESHIKRLQSELQRMKRSNEELESRLVNALKPKTPVNEPNRDRLNEELLTQRNQLNRVREESRSLRSDYDELQLKYREEVANSQSWKSEKQRLEKQLQDLNQAYEASAGARAEQQSQIVSLHSQVRELRGVLDDAEADRSLLQKARRALQSELETIKSEHSDTGKLPSDQDVQRLLMALEEREDQVTTAHERARKAENYASECQIELGRVRVENSELDKVNENLEKQIKKLNIRIVDLETQQHAPTPRSSLGSRRVDEAANQTPGTLGNDRSLTKVKAYEAQVQTLREYINTLQSQEADIQAAKRRAERETEDYKQKCSNLERELEILQSKLYRSSLGTPNRTPKSPANPRK